MSEPSESAQNSYLMQKKELVDLIKKDTAQLEFSLY